MNIHNRGLILAGILVFLAVVTFPFWWGGGRPVPPPDLKLDTAAIAALKERLCIEPAPVMRREHMKLLETWRDGAVREGKRLHRTADGREFEVSLTGTCLRCHDNKEQFCDRCHDYAGVKPACWSCHIIPKEVR